MFEELKRIFDNAKGQTIELYQKTEKYSSQEFDSSEPKSLFTALNFEYEKKDKIIKLFDKLNPKNFFKININNFIGANADTNEFWIGKYNYTLIIYS